MIYVLTADHFLWFGIQTILSPYQPLRLLNGRYGEMVLNLICIDDIFIFDASIDPTPILMHLKKSGASAKFIFIKRKEHKKVSGLIRHCSSLDIDEPLDDIRHFILSAKHRTYIKEEYDFLLSPREARILHLSIDGLSVRKIATLLDINSKTVYSHRKRACIKFGVYKVCELAPYKKLVKLRIFESGYALYQEAVF